MAIPTRITPRQMLVSKLSGLYSLWEHDRLSQNTNVTWRTGSDLIYIWCATLRLNGGPPKELSDIIFTDLHILSECITHRSFNYASWFDSLHTVDHRWDVTSHDTEDLESEVHNLLEQLDKFELLCWFYNTYLIHMNQASNQHLLWINTNTREISYAEDYVARWPEHFMCLATDCAEIIANSRADLHENLDLLQTIGKYRRIEEARDQVELSRVIL